MNIRANTDNKELVDWTPDDMLEVTLPKHDSFLQVVETLTRIGIPNFNKKSLIQSCHILQKRQRYYIMNFKELFRLDGEPTEIEVDDIKRRNRVAKLLEEWGLVNIVDTDKISQYEDDGIKVFVLKHSEKDNWKLEANYSIGTRDE